VEDFVKTLEEKRSNHSFTILFRKEKGKKDSSGLLIQS